ncbi:MAG: DUF6029 family protein [Candidatus Cryptobacteroides sp.]
MRQNVRLTILAIAGLVSWTVSSAQTGIGVFSASLESNNIWYFQDNGLGVHAPEDRFGANDYLKMDYSCGKFSAGMQVEAYLPALYGYEIGTIGDPKQFMLGSKYIRWTGDGFTAHIGDIYDQWGNGLVFRSYEDRHLGFNNSVEGLSVSFSPADWLTLKAMSGCPRLYSDYASSKVRGANMVFNIDNLLNWDSVLLSLEGSFVNRYESLDEDPFLDFSTMGLTSPNLNMYSAALNFGWDALSLKAEYASKGKDIASPSVSNAHTGAAIYAEAIYDYNAFSASATFRILDHMGTMISLYGSGTGNALNYLPSLTRHYTYMLANLNPYQVNVVGESAFQADLFYTARRSRSEYAVLHANCSYAGTIDQSQTDDGSKRMMWMDISADAEIHWNKKLRTTLLYSRQEWSPSHGYQEGTYVSNIFVADALWRFSGKTALRAELQYLSSEDYEGDWLAGLLEVSFAPRWNVFASEMYNSGLTGKHYYNFGFSYSKGRSRVQLSYGRNRAGYICSGGVCRYSPAYTGVNLLLTTSF